MIKLIKDNEAVNFAKGTKDVANSSYQIICTNYDKNSWVEEHNDGLIAFYYRNQTFHFFYLRKYTPGESDFIVWLKGQGFIKS